jgi:hypothetical protein
MRIWQFLYMALAGALIGFGLISFDIMFISYPCLLAGIGLCIYGITRQGSAKIWAVLFGLGLLPALILTMDIFTAPPPCTGQPLIIPPHGSSASCGFIPGSYYVMAAIFWAIALAGIAGCFFVAGKAKKSTRTLDGERGD